MEIKWQSIVKVKTSVLFEWYILEGSNEEYFEKSLRLKTSLLNGKLFHLAGDLIGHQTSVKMRVNENYNQEIN